MSEDPDQLSARHNGRRTMAAFALALILVTMIEALLRAFAPVLSDNIAHIRDFDRLLLETGSAPAQAVIFVGNSLTNNGIQAQYLSALASAHSGQLVSTVKLVPDGTTLWDWRCVIDRLPPARHKDLLIMGFAWSQVADQQDVDIPQTFGLFCPLAHLTEISQYHSIGIGDWMEAGASKLSLTYVLRERLRNGVLTAIVPHYQVEAQRMNERARNGVRAAGPRDTGNTFDALGAAVRRAHSLGYQPVLIAMPTLTSYDVDPALPGLLRQLNVNFLDLRNEPWLRHDLFVDSIHLGPKGARLLTQTIASRVFGASRSIAETTAVSADR